MSGYKKPYWKPNKIFKRIKARIRRAKEKHALRNGREPEKVYKTDVWDWN